MTDNERILEILKAGGEFGNQYPHRLGGTYFSPCLYLVHDSFRGITSVGYSHYGSSAVSATPEGIAQAMEIFEQTAAEFMETHGLQFVSLPDFPSGSETILKNLQEGYRYFHSVWSDIAHRYTKILDLYQTEDRTIKHFDTSTGASETISATPEAIEKAIYQHYQQDPEQFVRTHEIMKGKLY